MINNSDIKINLSEDFDKDNSKISIDAEMKSALIKQIEIDVSIFK